MSWYGPTAHFLVSSDAVTPAQKAQLARDGFLVLPDFVSTEACDELRARALALVEAHVPPETRSIFSTRNQTDTSDDYFLGSGDQIRFFYEEKAAGAVNKIGHALHDLDPVFARFSRTPELRELAAALGFVSPLLMQSMYIFKLPRVGGEVRCHQDATFLYTEPLRVVGLWFALEDATRDNGCLWAIPGGHQLGLRRRFVRDGQRTRFVELDPQPLPEEAAVPLEVARGSLIVLDGLLPHLSHENRSDRSRHAYTLHLVEASARWPEENWLQRRSPARGF
jgi:phytanoyl-CoA hydroxylase